MANNLRPSHIEIEKDDFFEDSVLSTVTSRTLNESGIINSIGVYERPGEKKWNLTTLMISAGSVWIVSTLYGKRMEVASPYEHNFTFLGV